jgi:tetratricopeptide (TPR) repeat protein
MGTLERKAAELFARASALQQVGQLVEAASLYEQALTYDPNHADALINLGATLQTAGQTERARIYCERALAIAPDNAYAHCNLGVVLLELGEIEQARVHFARARDLAPRNGRIHRYLGEVVLGKVEAGHLRQMERLAGELDPSATDDRMNLHFALAKAYAAFGDHRRSFEQLRDGNALKRATVDYDESEMLRVLAMLPVLFGQQLMQVMAGMGHPSTAPIFIIGMPRSGTTLVEQVLAALPEVHAAGELRVFEHAMRGFSPINADATNIELFTELLANELRQLGARYAREVEALSPSAARVTDKNPFNFRFAGIIHLALPNARLIHVRRDPIDTCFSCFSSLFNEDNEFAYDLAELGRYYRAYEQLMAHWRAALPAGAMLEVAYEDLVDDFERQARRIVAYCELEWNDACNDFASVKRPIRTASAVAVRQPLYRTAIGRAAPYREYLQPLCRELGIAAQI